jgi:hypothetical protein
MHKTNRYIQALDLKLCAPWVGSSFAQVCTKVEGDFRNLKPYRQPLDQKVGQTTTFYKSCMVWFFAMVL